MFKKDNNLTSGKGEWDESKHPRDEDGKFISISEFRYLKEHPKEDVDPHPTHLYAKKGDTVKYHQLTHSEQIKDSDVKNIKLSHNPNPKDKRTAYFIPKSEVGDINNFDKVKKNWILSDKDDKKMKKYRDEPFDK